MKDERKAAGIRENDTTKVKLIKATQYLLATYGYEVASTRRIAKLADVTLSAISFHFETKDNLVHEAVMDAARRLQRIYSKLTADSKKYLEQPGGTDEETWKHIDYVISQTMHMTFNPKKSMVNIGLVEHENGFPPDSQGIISGVAVDENEKVLAQLINRLMGGQEMFRAAVIARAVMSAIMSFMEKPLLINRMEKELKISLSDTGAVEKCMHDYFIAGIRTAVEEQKQQK
ncbi:MAG: TetR family transcriptional regulator [Lachnospiraceae bacterium]|jgi:AcrR family transcriptional regulator